MVSDKLKAIFIHIPRTGGTSIESAFGINMTTLNLNEKHLSAIQIKNQIGDLKWDNYFKFSIVRNPYSRIVSMWKRQFYSQKNESLYKFLVHYKPAPHEYKSAEQTKILNLNIDFIGKFENIESDFAIISNKINFKSGLPHIEKSSHSDYQDYYNKRTVAVVKYLFKSDLKTFNYSFKHKTKTTKINLLNYYFYVSIYLLEKAIYKLQTRISVNGNT
jgi:hypothetical protein